MTTSTDVLNEEQRRAVHAPIGPTIVPAGPGSGKTLVVANRVAWMIADMDIPADSILVFTFTNRAARELRRRLQLRLPPDAFQDLFAGTFHSWGARFLRRNSSYTHLEQNFTIYDRRDALDLIRNAMAETDDPDLGNRRGPRWRLESITKWKSQGKTPDGLLKPWQSRLNSPQQHLPRHVHNILTYQRYQQLLQTANAADFEDLVTLPLWTIADHPHLLADLQRTVRHIIVDEYQDTSPNQHRLVTTLANRPDESLPSIFIVGDSDQAIYAFRSADIRNINQFRQRDYPNARELQLQNNYRSTPEIITAAQQLIEHNQERIPRQSVYTLPPGARLRWIEAKDPEHEARVIAAEIDSLLADRMLRPEQICIAYRINPQSRAVEKALRELDILYQVTGNFEFFQRAEIRRHMDYLRLAVNPRDTHTLKRIINIPPRGIGDKTLQEILAHSETEEIHLRTAIGEIPHPDVAGFNKRVKKNLRQLDEALTTLQRLAERDHPIVELIRHISNECGLKSHFANTTDGAQREANIMELHSLAEQTDDTDVVHFLEQSAISRESRTLDAGRVTLSTIHQTKGMEWPCVYVIGVEEGLLPHERNRKEKGQIEEERRLLYVAMTRAESDLTLSWCRRRGDGTAEPSRFLDELPADCWEQPLYD